ncbi:MAG: molybdopterin molybdotransferase MoeA [Gammaproteobacteria bacterium]|nr:molybdopterin molybdotransferase MoeA [Gammaproteobacteria bacterium]MCW8988151.1 molybdopterin molybdotransferase MoeA [Gammaproteobacteria bacterium]MCW9030184.1 molybdopterin molybdotransferase MoeA [Gammaproteobacteria bacterium]
MNKSIPVTSACDKPQTPWLNVNDAIERMTSSVKKVHGTEVVAIRDALNRVLAKEVISTINVPPYANSAMDGYAFNSVDLPTSDEKTLTLVGKSFAGIPFAGEVKPGECIRIMTGAQMAKGTDTVIMQEQVQVNDTAITIQSGHCKNENVRHIGEDIKDGDTVLNVGQLISPAELGVLASLGVAEVTVQKQLRIAFFSTGDELRNVDQVLEEGQIYDSNRYTIFGMLKNLGVELIDMGILPDDRQTIEKAFKKASTQADAIITSGGVSVGEADYVKETLDKLGKVDFWKIAMKPGKPLAFGFIDDAVFFGLPGNPVSVMATFYQFALPTLKTMMGLKTTKATVVKVPCKTALRKAPGRTDFQRGILQTNEQGELVVESIGMQASHVLSGMSKANCFIILPQDWGNVEAGTLVDVQPFHGLM